MYDLAIICEWNVLVTIVALFLYIEYYKATVKWRCCFVYELQEGKSQVVGKLGQNEYTTYIGGVF